MKICIKLSSNIYSFNMQTRLGGGEEIILLQLKDAFQRTAFGERCGKKPSVINELYYSGKFIPLSRCLTFSIQQIKERGRGEQNDEQY